MDFRIELVQDRADDRCANRFQLLLGPSHRVTIGASGVDDQKDSIHDAAKQQRVVHRQDRRRIQEHDAKPL